MKQSFLKYILLAVITVGSLFSCKEKSEMETSSKTTLSSKETTNLVVDFKDTGIKIQPTMYGIVNHEHEGKKWESKYSKEIGNKIEPTLRRLLDANR